MILFWVLAVLLALLAAALVVFPFWRAPAADEQDLVALNRRVFRERQAELEKDEAEGRIDTDTLQELRTELARNLLALDVKTAATTVKPKRIAAWLVIVLLPLLAAFFYYGLVAPQNLNDWWKLRKDMGPTVDLLLQGKTPPDTENDGHTLPDFIRVLQDRLQKKPQNPEGWFMLGMSYVQLDMPQPAQTAFEHAWRQSPDDPRYEMAYAQTRLFGNDGQLDGFTHQLLQDVLQKKPDHEGALVLLGMGAYHAGDYALAVSTLEQLQSVRSARHATGGPAVMHEVDQILADARNKLKQAASGAAAPAVASRIRVKVQVDRSLAGKFQPGDVVYVFARALNGPPMPVAVVRRTAGELPFTVELDDSQSVMPTHPLSAVPEVAVSARISRHGSPEGQPGDLDAVAVPVRQNGSAQSIELTIQTLRP
jgi:cytochrome c-type biogenesis protein CcmH